MNNASDADRAVSTPAVATHAMLDGRYRLTHRVGRGGMADVWAAEDSLLDRTVAVKVFRFDTDGVDEHRVQSEIRTIAQLSHPGIVTVYDAGTAHDDGSGTPYLVMELVDGHALSDRLADGPIGSHEVVDMACQLAATLDYLHCRGIVHRDIKPANILLQAATDSSGAQVGTRVRLTDFGVARLVDSSRLTAVGRTIGTARYLSPEQLTGAEVGPPSDIYSLGLVLLECLTGKPAFPGDGAEAAMVRLHQPPHVPVEVGSAWASILSALTASDPADRPNAIEVGRLLADLPSAAAPLRSDERTTVLATASVAPSSSTRVLPTIDRPPRRSSRRAVRRARKPLGRIWLWLTLALAVVIAGAAIAANTSNSPTAPTRITNSPGKAPAYPSVAGVAGQHLRQLEDAVG